MTARPVPSAIRCFGMRRENLRLLEQLAFEGREEAFGTSHCSGDRLDPVRVFEFVRANRAFYPVATMCPAAGGLLPAGTTRGKAGRRRPAPRATEQCSIASVTSTAPRAGPKAPPDALHAELVAQGHAVVPQADRQIDAPCRLERASVGARGSRTTLRDTRTRAAPDLAERDFTADALDRLWVADIT